MSALAMIPLALPSLPSAPLTPWSAEVVEAHHRLATAFLTSRRALNLDESDPIRLGHHLKQAETFMGSIIDVLGSQTNNPFPPGYIGEVRDSIALLVDGLHTTHGQATLVYVGPPFLG